MKRLVNAVNRLWKLILTPDYRHYICIAITICFAVCTLCIFPAAFGRGVEALCDFGLSAGYYFCEIFFIPHNITPTVNNLSNVLHGDILLPDNYQGFVQLWDDYWQLWASELNFYSYLAHLRNILLTLCQVTIVVVPFFFLLAMIFNRYLSSQNNDYNAQSRPLKLFKSAAAYTYVPAKAWLGGFKRFVGQHRYYWVAWLCIWAFNFNFFTIIIEFLAYYLYFVVSYDLLNIFRQLYKLAIDLAPMFAFVPLWAWCVLGFVVFDLIRKRIGLARLNHFERRNRGFINERPLVCMVVGTMGKGKTTMLTDMCLSTEVMFRDKAFEKILENDLKFPYFPWLNLENALKRAISLHKVYNLATCRAFVQGVRQCFLAGTHHGGAVYKSCKRYLKKRYGLTYDNLLFDYDYKRYGLTYDDKLKVADIWQVLETYAQLYFIYIVESSLLVSNYSIRTDMLISDLGNFPLWNSDFFSRDSRLIDSFSRHAHILDFDMLRLGRTVVENNKRSNALEFGVIAISEIGKERRNMLELKELKKNTDITNQKNDGFNDGLKMRRHSATVDNYAFIKIISDEQRPESLGADARDMFDIIYIKERSRNGLAMPFFSLTELIYSWSFAKFESIYYKYRYNRADSTVFMHVVKAVFAKLHGYYTRIYNRFGYNVLAVQVENGTMDGQRKDGKYFLSWKKIYSKRFSTDCMSAFWGERAINSPVGIDDLAEYSGSLATWDELKSQGSYFITELMSKNSEG